MKRHYAYAFPVRETPSCGICFPTFLEQQGCHLSSNTVFKKVENSSDLVLIPEKRETAAIATKHKHAIRSGIFESNAIHVVVTRQSSTLAMDLHVATDRPMAWYD